MKNVAGLLVIGSIYGVALFMTWNRSRAYSKKETMMKQEAQQNASA